MEILKLKPVGKDYLWGGERLKKEYGKNINLSPLAETWECSVHPDGPSVILNGQYRNKTLREVLKLHPEMLGKKLNNKDELPILVKFIDAQKKLSVQVHPDDNYALEHENQNGKTEMWYVLDANEDATLIYGFCHNVDEKILKNASSSNTLDKYLNKVHVNKGDVFFVPAGTVHGIGAGCLIAEIQQSSNVTYRVFDYNRVDKTGKKRELHFEKALHVMNMQASINVRQKLRLVHYYPNCVREVLCICKYFVTERIETSHGFAFSVLDNSFQIMLCLDGEGTIEVGGDLNKPLKFKKGDCLFIPAGAGRCYLFGRTNILKVRC